MPIEDGPDGSLVLLAHVDDVQPGTMKLVTAGDRAILIVNTEGSIHAVDGLCTHEDYPLDEGLLFGDDLVCGLHGSRFSVSTGEALDPPAERPLGRYPIQIKDGQILVDLAARKLEPTV